MFDQTFVGGRTRRTWTIVAAFVIQVAVIAAAVVIPLLFIQGLPQRELTGILLAPPPPPPPPPPPAPAIARPKVVKIIPRQFNANKLMAPRVIPKRVEIINEPQIQPPSTAVAGGVPGGVPGGSVGGVVGGVLNSPVTAAPPPPPPPKPQAPKRIRVGGNVQTAKLENKVMPQYPPLAKQARIQGTVRLQAVISKDGTVQNLQVVSGHPLLVPAAIQAVRQWRYKPTYLNGEPVEVVTEIDVNFSLSS